MNLIKYYLLCPLFLSVCTGCIGDVHKVSRQLLGTTVTISLTATGAADEYFNAGFGEIESVQKKFNINDPDSEISELNSRAASGWYKTDDEIYALIRRSLEVSELTDGSFDITWASAGKLWDLSGETFTPPDDGLIKSRLLSVSFRNIALDDRGRRIKFLNPGTKIGMGGVAKGYAVQKAVTSLKRMGVEGAIVACAGDIQVIGSNYGRPWRGGIQDPRGKSVIATFSMSDGESVSTSGDYERFRIVNGRRYHHIIDPATGYPADSGLISVTVFSRDPVTSDAFATAFFVAGLEKTVRVLSARSDVAAVLVDADMKVHVSLNLKSRLRFREDLKVVYF